MIFSEMQSNLFYNFQYLGYVRKQYQINTRRFNTIMCYIIILNLYIFHTEEHNDENISTAFSIICLAKR